MRHYFGQIFFSQIILKFYLIDSSVLRSLILSFYVMLSNKAPFAFMNPLQRQQFFGNLDNNFLISLFGSRNPDCRVMSVGEGSYQGTESKFQDPFHQLPSESVKFISLPPHSLAAPSQAPHFVHSPDQQGIPINYQSHNCNRRPRFTCLPNSGGDFSIGESDSAVQLLADQSNPTPLNDIDFQLMNIDQNMSPSSGITSVCFLLSFHLLDSTSLFLFITFVFFYFVPQPMDLGFTNIGDEQSIDSIDLNNITPSIKLASSVSFTFYLCPVYNALSSILLFLSIPLSLSIEACPCSHEFLVSYRNLFPKLAPLMFFF